MKDTWEKVFEYASFPLHETMSGKLRQGCSYRSAKTKYSIVLFSFQVNSSVSRKLRPGKIESIRTYSKKED
jgi:hypothetical protein